MGGGGRVETEEIKDVARFCLSYINCQRFSSLTSIDDMEQWNIGTLSLPSRKLKHTLNGYKHGGTDGRTDRPSYRDAKTHLKTKNRDSSLLALLARFAALACSVHSRNRVLSVGNVEGV